MTVADDIVSRLRSDELHETWRDEVVSVCLAAADEIERWRAEASLKGYRLDDALDEIERLREQVKAAHNILGSETMIWVFHGSENWLESNLQHLRDPIHAYWEKYGNAFKEARRG